MRLARSRAEKSSFPPVFPLFSETVISPLFPGLWAFFAGNCPKFVPKWAWDNWEVAMVTIVTRKGANGPGFQARLRLTRNGKLVHKESRTFATKGCCEGMG